MMFLRGRYGHGGRKGYDREWRANPALSGGGELIDQGVHLIDLAGWFLGDFTTHDGGIYDDPADDTEWEKLKFGWADAIRTWDITFLRDNPLAQLYTNVETAASKAAETAGDVAGGVAGAAKSIAKIIKWAPYVVAGIGAVGMTAVVLATTRRPHAPTPSETNQGDER